jgi:hypothetical protein
MDEQLLVEPFEHESLTGLEEFQKSHMSANLAIFEDGSVSSEMQDKFQSPIAGMRSEDEQLIDGIMETTRQDMDDASGSLKSDALERSFQRDVAPAQAAYPHMLTIAVPKSTLLDRFHSSDLTIFEDGSAMFDSSMLDGLIDTTLQATKKEIKSSPTSVWDRSPATPESLPREKVYLSRGRPIRYFADGSESEAPTTPSRPSIPRFPRPLLLHKSPTHGASPLQSNLRNTVDCKVWKIKSLPKASSVMKVSPVPVAIPLTRFLECRSAPKAPQWQPQSREGCLASTENIEMEVWSVRSGASSLSSRIVDMEDDVSVSVLRHDDEIRQAILAKFQAAQEIADPVPKASVSTTRRRLRRRRRRANAAA